MATDGLGGTGQVLDLPALDAVETQLVELERARQRVHAAELRAALTLRRLHAAAGTALLTVPQLALLWGCSEARAHLLLSDAEVLDRLPGALTAVFSGVLGVEQSRAVADVLGPVPGDVARDVWQRVLLRLEEDARSGAARPPARLRELLNRSLRRCDPDGCAERRRLAVRDADVQRRRRDDGLVDVWASGLQASDAQAALDRIDAFAEASGPDDDRTAGQRRAQAWVDLVLGRVGSSCASGCGCPSGAAAPCGASLTVLVPIGAARETSGEVAELVGHGPLDRSELRALLRAAPTVHAVHVDDAGLPVALSAQTWQPGRDPVALSRALEDDAGSRPAERVPRHPDDHRAQHLQPESPGYREPLPHVPPESLGDREPLPHVPPGSLGDREALPHVPPDRRPLLRRAPHLPGTPGPYRLPVALWQLLQVRSPRCEWPGCGARAARCDAEHDVAWPAGPTCGCNCGPLCRRHHRCKQSGWTKVRTGSGGVRWTSPTGRSWLSPAQHDAPDPVTPPWHRPDPEVPPEGDRLQQLLDRGALHPLDLPEDLRPHRDLAAPDDGWTPPDRDPVHPDAAGARP